MVSGEYHVQSTKGTLEFTVKASDRDKKSARKQLSIADFCGAFLKYKPIINICHEFPNRHDEFDAYLPYILDLYTWYQGNTMCSLQRVPWNLLLRLPIGIRNQLENN